MALGLLNSCLFDLDLIEGQRTLETSSDLRKQVRLEIIFDLLREYFIVAILALLIIKLPWFQRRWENRKKTARLTACLLLTVAAVTFGSADMTRYGNTSWSYFDIQIVLTVCAGLLSGFFPTL